MALRQAVRFCSTTRAAASAKVGMPPGRGASRIDRTVVLRRTGSTTTTQGEAIDAER